MKCYVSIMFRAGIKATWVEKDAQHISYTGTGLLLGLGVGSECNLLLFLNVCWVACQTPPADHKALSVTRSLWVDIHPRLHGCYMMG